MLEFLSGISGDYISDSLHLKNEIVEHYPVGQVSYHVQDIDEGKLVPLKCLFLKLSLQYESHAFESETEDYHDEEDEG